MSKERRKLGYELNQNNAYLLGDATPHLKQQKFDPEKEYFEFLIRGKIKPEDLRLLLTLPYEIEITDSNQGLVLSTGGKNRVRNIDDTGIRMREQNSDLMVHTHPLYDDEFPVTTPSFGDVLAAATEIKKTAALIHPKGIMIYTAPIINQETGTQYYGQDVHVLVSKYGIKNRVYIWGRMSDLRTDEGKKMYNKSFHDMSQEEQVRFQRQFAEESGMIVDEAGWDDKAGLEPVVAKAFKGIRQ